jgi:hypothetical protein
VSLTVIVPTKERPGNASRLAHAFAETRTSARLLFALDDGERQRDAYFEQVPSPPWLTIATVEVQPQRMGPVLNVLAAHYAYCTDYIGFMGDDHLPQSDGWDEKLVEALDGRPGVAYGNDLAQGEKLPTAVVISSDIIQALGFMCPPGQDHLYLDDFWKFLGQIVGNFAYCPDVVIEHLHPNYAKARWDESYAQTNSADQYARDKAAYERFLAEDWPGALTRLKEAGIVK